LNAANVMIDASATAMTSLLTGRPALTAATVMTGTLGVNGATTTASIGMDGYRWLRHEQRPHFYLNSKLALESRADLVARKKAEHATSCSALCVEKSISNGIKPDEPGVFKAARIISSRELDVAVPVSTLEILSDLRLSAEICGKICFPLMWRSNIATRSRAPWHFLKAASHASNCFSGLDRLSGQVLISYGSERRSYSSRSPVAMTM